MKTPTIFPLLLLLFIVSCKDDPEPALDAQSTILYEQDFSVDNVGWVTDSTAYHVRKFYQGHYSIRQDSVNIAGFSLAPYPSINFPYSVQVDGIIQLDDPKEVGFIGIVFNYTDKNHFSIFEIANDGTYFIWSYDNGSTSSIAPDTNCPSFKTGSGVRNTLKISQNADKIQLRINDVVVARYPSTLPNDYVYAGVFVGTANRRDPGNAGGIYFTPTTGLFNNFILTKN